MPRHYKREVGARKYADYTAETLSEALERISRGEITRSQAEIDYKIPRRTLFNKLNEKHTSSCGRPRVFDDEEESSFVKCMQQLSDSMFPITLEDLKYIVSAYLQKSGRKVSQFKGGHLPGQDWAAGFMKRHPELSQRFAQNIKRVRAGITPESLKEYVTNLSKSLENVPPENIINYDETNLSDDPGSKKVIVKRGSKYPAVIMNSSKSSISLMFAGSAAGELFPPFVVYKSSCLWSTWIEGGPPGARYANTTSGWFDACTFEEWFVSMLLPHLKKKVGPKAMIGDNLSSHISPRVVELCEKNNIRFICLPPNSTHLTQPLDVAFFRPLKAAWRKILTEYKNSAQGARKTSLDKQHFPALLNKLMEALKSNQEQNLISGFRKCSIHPIDLEELLKGFKKKDFNTVDIEDSFKAYLDRKTKDVLDTRKTMKRKKIQIASGKSVEPSDLLENGDEENIDDVQEYVVEESHVQENVVKENLVKENSVEDRTYMTSTPSTSAAAFLSDCTPIPTLLSDATTVTNPFAKSPKKKQKKRKLLTTVAPFKSSDIALTIKKIKREIASKNQDQILAPLKTSAQGAKAKVQSKAPLVKDPLCERCSLSSKNLHCCKECKKCYHRTCIPKDYDFLLSDDEEEEFFICPKCKTEVVDGNSKEEDNSDDSFF